MKVFLACGLSYKNICKFEKQYYKYDILQRYDDKIFYELVKNFRKRKADV